MENTPVQTAGVDRKRGELSVALQPLGHSHGELVNISRRLISIADRLGGPQPPPSTSDVDVEVAKASPNTLAEIHNYCEMYNSVTNQLNMVTNRLEELA